MLTRDKFARQLHEDLKLIVMHPVPRAVDTFHDRVLEMLRATIDTRIRGAAFIAVDQQRGASNAGPQLFHFRVRHVVGRPGAHVVIEFPGKSAVLVLIDTLTGQSSR